MIPDTCLARLGTANTYIPIPISPADGTNGTNGSTEAGKEPPVEYVDTDPITVFHDPDNFNVKHPLMNTWTLWFTKPPSGKVRHCSVLGVDCSMLTTAGRQLGRTAEGGHLI